MAIFETDESDIEKYWFKGDVKKLVEALNSSNNVVSPSCQALSDIGNKIAVEGLVFLFRRL
jgi:hypothetical protein